jgi:hypothetical protein
LVERYPTLTMLMGDWWSMAIVYHKFDLLKNFINKALWGFP